MRVATTSGLLLVELERDDDAGGLTVALATLTPAG
jgi:hypothetical protein